MKKLYTFLAIIVVLALMGVFILIRTEKYKIIEVKKEDVASKLQDVDYAILYTGELTDAVKNRLVSLKKEKLISGFHTAMSTAELNKLIVRSEIVIEENEVYVLFLEGEPLTVVSKDASNQELMEQIDKYFYNIIPESERNYQVVGSADQYIQMVNGKNYTVAVFGATSCSYCNLYLPIVNDVAKNYNVPIYYFDEDKFDHDELSSILDLELEIPEECTKDGEPKSMLEGYGKPLTIITRKGKIEGCIRGYVTEDMLVDKLKEFKLVKEKK